MRTALRAKVVLLGIAAGGHDSVTSQFTRDGDRLKPKDPIHRGVACRNILAKAAPACPCHEGFLCDGKGDGATETVPGMMYMIHTIFLSHSSAFNRHERRLTKFDRFLLTYAAKTEVSRLFLGCRSALRAAKCGLHERLMPRKHSIKFWQRLRL